MITIEINDDQISAALARLVGAVSKMEPVNQEIAEALQFSSRKRIADGVTPEGTAFAPRSAATLAIYAKTKPPKVPGAKPLTVSGDLMRSLTGFATEDVAGVRTNRIYSAVMQFGAAKGTLGAYWYTTAGGAQVDGSSPWGNIPARPFLGLSDEDRTNVSDIVVEWLKRAATGGAA
jgi:phage virion morphogenesis protein